MSLLLHEYNPTATVATLVNAMEAGQRRRTAQEQITAGLVKAISDDRRQSIEFDRLQAFNASKLAESTRLAQADDAESRRRYDATATESRRRYDSENAPVDVVEPGAPPAPAGGFAEQLAATRSNQAQEGLSALEKLGPGEAEMQDIAQQIREMSSAGPDTSTPDQMPGSTPLPPDPFSMPDISGGAMPPPPGAPPRPDGLPAGRGEPANGPDMLAPQVSPPSPGRTAAQYIAELKQAGIPVKQKDLAGIQRAFARGSGSSAAAKNTAALQEYVEKNELTKVEGRNSYRMRDGTEVYVEQGASGGIAVKPVKELQKAVPKPFKGSDGNTYIMRGEEPHLIVRKEVSDKLPTSVPMKYATALAEEGEQPRQPGREHAGMGDTQGRKGPRSQKRPRQRAREGRKGSAIETGGRA